MNLDEIAELIGDRDGFDLPVGYRWMTLLWGYHRCVPDSELDALWEPRWNGIVTCGELAVSFLSEGICPRCATVAVEPDDGVLVCSCCNSRYELDGNRPTLVRVSPGPDFRVNGFHQCDCTSDSVENSDSLLVAISEDLYQETVIVCDCELCNPSEEDDSEG